MKFTVVFGSHESYDLSYGLVFIPSPCWVKAGEVLVNLNPESPHYQLGSVRKLLEKEEASAALATGPRRCVVVIHDVGNGSSEDLDRLEMDLRQQGFTVTTYRL